MNIDANDLIAAYQQQITELSTSLAMTKAQLAAVSRTLQEAETGDEQA